MTNAVPKPEPSNGDNANANAKKNPKPYTEYTIFFRLERTYLLQSEGIIDEEVVSSLDPSHYDPLEFPRPARYERLAMPPYWYSSSHKAVIEKKRKHRKRAGRMDLQTLSKTISASWRNADQEITDYCRKLAKAEMEKYKQRMEMEGILKNKDWADKVTSANARAEVGSGARQQQTPLPLPTKTPSMVASASPFVLAQAKQQAGHFVLPQRPSNLLAPNSNGALSLQNFAFSKPKQAEKVALEVTSNCALSLQDLVVSKAKQFTNTTVPMSKPPAAAPVRVIDNNSNKLRDSYNEIMGFSSTGGPKKQEDAALRQVLKLQAVQFQKMNNRSALSRTVLERAAVVDGGVRPENRPEKKNKRKLLRRVSAPPEFLAHEKMLALQARATANVGGGRAAASLGGDPPKRAKRRSSMIDPIGSGQGLHLDAKDLRELRAIRQARASLGSLRATRRARATMEARGLSESFERELDNVRFTNVPEWERQDADELLDLLDVPRAGEPTVTADQDMRMFLDDIGMGDDDYCKVI